MSIRDRAAALFAVRPRPEKPEPVELDDEKGEYGGKRDESYSGALDRSLHPLLATGRKLTSRNVAEMRRHYQVNACLTVLAMPIDRADWSIECDDDDVRDWLTSAYALVAADVAASSTKSLWAGYSPNVLRWTADPELGGLVVNKIRDLDPATCEPLVDPAGSYAGFVQNRRTKAIEIHPLESLWLVEGMESGNLFGRSVLEAALDPWLDATAVRLFHARYLERFGEPVVRSRAPAGRSIGNAIEIELATIAKATDPSIVIPDPIIVDNLTRGREIGESLRHHSVVSLPSEQSYSGDGKPLGYSWDLDYLESKGSGGADFREALDGFDRAIARALFVPDLLFANTDGGAYALGREHRSVFDGAVEGRLDDNARQITRHLIDRLRVWNFGERAPAARLVFGGVTDVDRAELWELAKLLLEGQRLPIDVEAIGTRLGIPLSDAEEDAAPVEANPFASVGLPALVAAGIITETEARGLLGIEGDAPEKPTPEAVAVVEEIAARAARGETIGGVGVALARSALGLGPLARPVVELAATVGSVDGLPDWKLPQSFDPPPYRRELTSRESRSVFAKLEGGMTRAEEATIEAISEILDVQRERVLRQLRGILKKPTVAEQLAALGTLDLGTASKSSAAFDALLRETWTLGLESVAAELTAYAEAVPTTLGPTARAMAATYAQASAERHLSALSTELRLQLANAITSDVSSAGMSGIVGDLYDRELRSEGRPMRLTTRMLSAKGTNEGRRDAIERGGIPLRGAQYSALMDRRTCELCLELDETVIAVEHPDLSRFTPPVHHNCRCVWVWITRDEADFEPTWQTPSSTKVGRYGGLVI